MSIAIFALFTALCLGLFAAEIIWTAITYSKAAHYKNRIRVNNSSPWLASNWAALFYFAVQFYIAIFYLHEFDFLDFTETVFYILKAILSGSIALDIIFRMVFGTRAYITDDGIIAVKAFFPKGKAKYEVKKSEVGTYINLHTKNRDYDFSFKFKPKYEEDIINIMDYLGYEKYDENDNTVMNLQKQSYVKRNLIILLCTSLIFVGGIFSWYENQKPFIFVKDVIIPTNTEWAMFNGVGFADLMLSNRIDYYDDLNVKTGEMLDNQYHSQNLTAEDIVVLKEFPNLKYLDLVANNIDDLTTIGELTQLEGLAIGGGKMFAKPTDYSPLKNLTKLKYFIGFGLYNFNDMTVFENADDLAYLELTYADIQSGLDVIGEKKNLLDLEMYSCTADDFSPIGNCTNLKRLVISNTNVTDLSFIENLNELEYLNISNTNAENYSVLLELPSLKMLSAHNCDIPAEIINELTEKGVEIYD